MRFWRAHLVALLLALASACQRGAPASAPAATASATAQRFEPSRDLGPLFADVELSGIFADSKTFADARVLSDPAPLTAHYMAARTSAKFDLRVFVGEHFALPHVEDRPPTTNPGLSMEQHLRALWPTLTRPADLDDPRSSLIPLPFPYVVPGGRFREAYYWDAYFTMLGLVESGRIDLLVHTLDNLAHLVHTFGHVPNGNRSYYLSRSQPPYFASMVALYARATDLAHATAYLDALEAEHAFWMDGAEGLAIGQARQRVVRLANGVVLNRYWDERQDPRPESYREDVALAKTLPERARASFYRQVRASAESGWDFSSRWMRDPRDLRTLETTELVPVDLNSILYDAEQVIATLRTARGRAGDAEMADAFRQMAARRRATLQALAYDPATGFYYDVRFGTGERVTDRPTLAAAAALFFGVASEAQGRAVAQRLERDFLAAGGFVTTLIESGQQWDAPNGWAPLQWLAIQGAQRYGRSDLAAAGRARWLALNRRVYEATGKMTEKYDVLQPGRRAGGGEYPTQDGFGWSNGVALALAAQERHAVNSP
jgi:alpha,alpha-trehalase